MIPSGDDTIDEDNKMRNSCGICEKCENYAVILACKKHLKIFDQRGLSKKY